MLGFGLCAAMISASQVSTDAADLPAIQTIAEELSDTNCRALHAPYNKNASPLAIISEGSIPGPKKLRKEPTPTQMKCATSLREAGKRAIEKKKNLVEGATRYVAAVNAAPAQAESTYQELANVLDRSSYLPAALGAYFKAWQAFEANYNSSDAKLDGVAVLALADIRDSIMRLGGQAPQPTSEVGRIVIANTTRRLREQYFNADPLLPENKPTKP